MTVAELFGKLKALGTAIRANEWLTVATLVGELLVAFRQERDAERAAGGDSGFARLSCPCDPADTEALATWCEAQALTYTGAAGATAFPWGGVFAILRALLDLLATR